MICLPGPVLTIIPTPMVTQECAMASRSVTMPMLGISNFTSMTKECRAETASEFQMDLKMPMTQLRLSPTQMALKTTLIEATLRSRTWQRM